MHPTAPHPALKAAPVLLGLAFLALTWLERRRPLRPRVRAQAPRLAANLASGAAAALVVAGTSSLTRKATTLVEQRRVGLLPWLGVGPSAQHWLSVLLMDYTLYWWHVLMHRVPVLWRSHRHHHHDADLDVSTALRFNAIEMLWSVPWRVGQILLIGVPARSLATWSSLTGAEVMFHHSNLRLPRAMDRALAWVVVTPRMHGVHHSNTLSHQHSNFSSGLALWDRLHGTAGPRPPQHRLVMGLPPPSRDAEGSDDSFRPR
jgi:sterol desaturase/sphingolipid hydroxylase (fatty acid hydroxylase superfamily)